MSEEGSIMMSKEEKQSLFRTSEALKKEEKYESALEILKPLDCVEASYMKGKIYKAAAERLANSFMFKHYCTDAQMTKYREFLSHAQDYFYQASSLLPMAGFKIQDELNQTLWYDIGAVCNELARTRPMEEDKSEDYDEDYDEDEEFQKNEGQHVDSMVDHLEFCSL